MDVKNYEFNGRGKPEIQPQLSDETILSPDSDSTENVMPQVRLKDPLDWLEGRNWDDLPPEVKERLIRDTLADATADEVFSRRYPYMPHARITALIGILSELGVVDAGSIDEEFIRENMGIEVTERPYELEEAVRRVKARKERCDSTNTTEACSVRLDDITHELHTMDREKEFQHQLEDDMRFLTFVGVDFRQLGEMAKRGKDEQKQIRKLAADLRSPLASDIAQRYADRLTKVRGLRAMVSVEDISLSVLARKNRQTRIGAGLEGGDGDAIRRAGAIYRELVKTDAGIQQLMAIVAEAERTNDTDVKELLTAVIRQAAQSEGPGDEEQFMWAE